MAEWHIAPDYIVNNWTDELFELMLEKMVERKERENSSTQGARPGEEKVSEELLSARGSNLIEVKHGD